MAKNLLSNPGPALDLTAKIATAAVSKNSKQASSAVPELITFNNTGEVFSLTIFEKHSYKSINKNYIYTYKSNLYYINGTKL